MFTAAGIRKWYFRNIQASNKGFRSHIHSVEIWLPDYILPSKNETDFKYEKVLFPARHADCLQSTKLTGNDILFSDDQVVAMMSRAFNSNAVMEITSGQHEDLVMRSIRGVKTGLRTRKRKLTATDFHWDHGHIGCVGPYSVCDMASGRCRRIYALVDNHVKANEATRGSWMRAWWNTDLLTARNTFWFFETGYH